MERKTVGNVLAMVFFLVLAVSGTLYAQEEKKIDGNIGWVTMDRKGVTLVKDGKHLMDLEMGDDVAVKIMEEQKGKKGKKSAPKEGGEAEDGVETICYTIKPATKNDILSGWKASITYDEKGKKKIAKEVVVSPVKFEGEGDD